MTKRMYTALKNTDLHALSAFETIVHIMHYSPLIALHRYQQWELSLAKPDQSLDFLTRSYALLNVNKERLLDVLPTYSLPPNVRCLRVVSTSVHVDVASVLDTLNRQFGHPLTGLSHHVVWDLHVTVDHLTDQDVDKAIEEEVLKKVVWLSCLSDGLLVNPLLESATCSLLSASS